MRNDKRTGMTPMKKQMETKELDYKCKLVYWNFLIKITTDYINIIQVKLIK